MHYFWAIYSIILLIPQCLCDQEQLIDLFRKAPIFTLPPLPEFPPKPYQPPSESDENRVLPRFSSGQDSYTYYTDVQEPQRDDTVKPKKVPDFFPKTVMSINNGRLVKVERVSGSICGIEDSYMLDAEDMATAVKVIQAMNLTRSEVNRISEYADSFDVASILDAIYPHVFQLDEKTQSRALQLLQDYGPPESLVRAVQSLTMEQKGHIQELRHKKRLGEVKVITRGIIFSLPDEDQLQARKFVAALRFMFDYDKAMTY